MGVERQGKSQQIQLKTVTVYFPIPPRRVRFSYFTFFRIVASLCFTSSGIQSDKRRDRFLLICIEGLLEH